ncbi:MAG TPA: hypothetical protein PKO44_06575 [Candidatus Omnitrophota bacterium]|nr:hypothetical protein [Candidatus Omnitrophota bacterium]
MKIVRENIVLDENLAMIQHKQLASGGWQRLSFTRPGKIVRK